MGTYFFLSKERIENRRTAYNIMNLLSEVGGFAGLTVMILSFFMTEITFHYVIYYFIRHFYSCNNKRVPLIESHNYNDPWEEDISSYEYLDRDFNVIEIIGDIWYLRYLFCCFRNLGCMKYRL